MEDKKSPVMKTCSGCGKGIFVWEKFCFYCDMKKYRRKSFILQCFILFVFTCYIIFFVLDLIYCNCGK